MRHLLRTAGPTEVRGRVGCEGVAGDEVNHGGDPAFQPGSVQVSVICIWVPSRNLDHAFSVATADRALALLEEILCGFKLLSWVTELFMVSNPTGGI